MLLERSHLLSHAIVVVKTKVHSFSLVFRRQIVVTRSEFQILRNTIRGKLILHCLAEFLPSRPQGEQPAHQRFQGNRGAARFHAWASRLWLVLRSGAALAIVFGRSWGLPAACAMPMSNLETRKSPAPYRAGLVHFPRNADRIERLLHGFLGSEEPV